MSCVWQEATAPQTNLYTAESDSDTEDPDVRTKPCFKRNCSVGQDTVYCSLLIWSLLCFPSPVSSPPLSTHLFFLPLGFKLLPRWLLATDRCLLLCGCNMPDFTWAIKSRFIPRPYVTCCLDYSSRPNLLFSCWHISLFIFFFVQGAIRSVTVRTVCVILQGLCVPSGSPSRLSGTDRERDREVCTLPGGEEEEEEEEEEAEEETARPLSHFIPVNLNTIPDTFSKDCVENNLFHKGIKYSFSRVPYSNTSLETDFMI